MNAIYRLRLLALAAIGLLVLAPTQADAQSRYRINFSDAATAPPAGWLRDQGEPFGLRANGETYGWVDPLTFTPVDIQNRGRNRNPSPDVDLFRETLMHMQFSDVSAGAQD
ncbi:MAG: hypothetical protein AAF840_16030 [Bacteroidota bacterium]